MIHVLKLEVNHSEFALLLETSGNETLHLLNLSCVKVLVCDLEIGCHV